MDSEELLKVAYTYYPKGVNSILDKEFYIGSGQYRALTEEINKHKDLHSKKRSVLFEELNSLGGTEFTLADSTNFEWQDRCYTYEFVKNVENHSLILKFYNSIIAPFFVIRYFESKVIKNVNRFYRISEMEFQHKSLVKNIYSISKKNELKQLSNKISETKIPDINFDDIQMGQFTFFNVFFNSENL